MCESIILSLPRTKCENVRVLFSRIRLLFGVSVDPSLDLNLVQEPTDQTSGQSSAGKSIPDYSQFKLSLVEGSLDQLGKAKDYLLSACSELRCERRCVYSADVLSQLLPMRDEVERDTSALVRFEPQENQVVVCGQERQVAAAIRCLDAKACDISATALSHLGVQQSREVFRQGGRNLESEDSSYDSDYELTEPNSNEPPHHDDVSRTVSDTLAAEFAEYVTTTDPHYTSRVEFALKLGYTETQVQIALQKLGCAQPSNNELLAELIKLGAVVTKGVLPVSPVGEEDTMAVIDHFETEDNLRHIVIDGSNVAMSHGNKECFSCRGIKLCVDWFRARGHQNITVFVPRYRKENSRPDAPIKDQEILAQLEKDRLLVFTPSRHVGGRRLVCYDDRYILRLAADSDGVVVSNDNYRDLVIESPDFKKVVENRLLMYSFVNDRFMPPDDPLGRHGPSLDNFLRKSPSRPPEPVPPPCPYGKKCTYGNKCKYHHPERGNLPQKSVTERLAEQAKIPLQEVKSRGLKSRESSPGDKLKSSVANKAKKQPLSRTKSLVPPTHDVISEKRDAVERTKSEGSSALKMQQMSYSTTYPWSSTGMPQISLNSDHSGVNAWANVPTTLPLSLPGAADMFLESEGGGGHLFVAKRLSDPDAKSLKPTTQGPPEMGNLHRKLQRQLTLNPAYDPRLGHMPPSSDRNSRLEPPRYNLAQQMLRSSSQENVHLLQSSLGQHQPLNRMGSAGPPLSVWDTHHQTVTRIASAPDSYNQQWPRTNASGRMQHLNSTSDTRLNLYPDLPQHPPYMADVQQHSYPPPLEMQSQHSYPPPVDMQPQQHLQQLRHWLSGSLEPRPMWSHGSSPQVPVRPSSVPPPGLLQPPGGSGRPASPDLFSEGAPRYRLYFHLASIFPKDQVQTVMDMYPQETNPQKICAAILNMFPKG